MIDVAPGGSHGRVAMAINISRAWSLGL